MNLKDFLTLFIAFREQVITRRTKFLLNKARDRAHILVGLAIAVANIDEIIRVIRTSPDPNTARDTLMSRDWPAKDVAAMITLIDDPRHRLAETAPRGCRWSRPRPFSNCGWQRLTALGREEISEELDKLAVEIADYLEILRSRARVQAIVKDELAEVKAKFATPRKTVIIEQEDEVEDEDLIQREDMVVTVSHAGYVKRVPLSAYRAQRRGGKGRAGMQTRDEDFVSRLFVASTHTPVLFFSSRGQVYKEKVWRLPVAAPNGRGKALINILPLEQGERITTIMPLPEDESSWANLDVMFATTGGTVRRNKLSDFVDVRRSGIIAMKLDEGEAIVDVQICTEHDDVLLTAAGGQCIRFPVTDVRVFTGRTSMGVRGIALPRERQADLAVDPQACRGDLGRADRLPENAPCGGRRGRGRRALRKPRPKEDDSGAIQLSSERYVEMSAQEQVVLTVSVNGYGKRTSSFEYRTTGRGGKGIVAMSVNNRNGKLVASFPVEESDQIMLVTDKGQLIRCPVEGIRIAGRSTQGVIVFDTAEDEHVVSVEHIGEDTENGNGNVMANLRATQDRAPETQMASRGASRSPSLRSREVGRNREFVAPYGVRSAVTRRASCHGLLAGDAEAGSLEVRPGLLRAVL